MAENFSDMQCISNIGCNSWDAMLRANVGEKTYIWI